jgi:hypothetical protein
MVEVVEMFREEALDLESLVDVAVVDQVEDLHRHRLEDPPLKIIMVETDTTDNLVVVEQDQTTIVVEVAVAAVVLVKMARTLEMVMVESECRFRQHIDIRLTSMF